MSQNKLCPAKFFGEPPSKAKALPTSQGGSLLIPASLEIAGSRNHYVPSVLALPSNVTKRQVKADFEKLAQGGRLLSVHAEEASEIERSFFREINEAVASPGET